MMEAFLEFECHKNNINKRDDGEIIYNSSDFMQKKLEESEIIFSKP